MKCKLKNFTSAEVAHLFLLPAGKKNSTFLGVKQLSFLLVIIVTMYNEKTEVISSYMYITLPVPLELHNTLDVCISSSIRNFCLIT